MYDFLAKLFDTSDFPARWRCGNWSSFEGWLHIISDATICFAYVAIPASLFVLLRHRRDIRFPVVIWLFIVFILSCGITHGFETMIFWWPAYRVTGLLKAMTAIVSVVTAICLVRVIPHALEIPKLYIDNAEMTNSLSTLSGEKVKLATVHSELEKRTADLVLRERRMREAVASARACAIAFDTMQGKVLWEMGCSRMLESFDSTHLDSDALWSNLLGDRTAQLFLAAAREACAKGESYRVTMPLRGYETTWQVRISVSPEPAPKGVQKVMVGLMGIATVEQMNHHLGASS